MNGKPADRGKSAKTPRDRPTRGRQEAAHGNVEQLRENSDGKKGGARRGFAGKLVSARAHAPVDAGEAEIEAVATSAFLDDRDVDEVWREVADAR